MKEEIAALDLYFLVKEFQELINAKINQIYQPSKKEFLFEFHVPNKGKKLLRVVIPGFLYLTETKGDMPEKPHGFCTYLRKQFKNSRLREVKQKGFERILEIVLEKKEGKKKIIFEFFDKGNVIVTDMEENILTVLEFQKWTKRTVKSKEKYKYPTKGFEVGSLDGDVLKGLVSNTEQKTLIKFLAVDLGLGGTYAEEVCLRLDIDKNQTPKFSKELLKEVKGLFEKSKAVVVKGREIFPIEMKLFNDSDVKEFKDFNSALDSVLTEKIQLNKTKEKNKVKEKAVGKIDKMLDAQKKQIETMNAKAEESQIKGELLYNNYQLVKEILDELNKARKKYSWKEVKAKLKDHEVIKAIKEKTGKIVLELK